MPTNEQRREAAKRKLEQQLERRAQQARRNRILAIAGSIGAVLLVVAAATTTTIWVKRGSQDDTTAQASGAAGEQPGEPSGPQLPKFTPSPTVGANCAYPQSAQPAAKEVQPPKTNNGKVPTDPAQVSVSMMTDQGPIGLLLDNAESPCTVNSFVSLASQKYFDDTPCHRLTTAPDLHVLQCGDPSGDGSGGPGYQFANEYPTDQYQPGDPALQEPVEYPRGTLAMANAGPGTNGSQFFLVYANSKLPPAYTVFGKIQDDGLATLEKIAKGGVEGGGSASDDGKPATKVVIQSVRMD